MACLFERGVLSYDGLGSLSYIIEYKGFIPSDTVTEEREGISEMKHKTIKRLLSGTVLGMAMLFCTSCSIFGGNEEEHKIEIFREDVSSSYDLALADISDVRATDTISCKYSELATCKYKFEVSGYKVAYVYVQEGDSVVAGQVLARLDVSSLENDVEDLNMKIEQTELKIRQQQELIDYYESKLKDTSVSLLNRESFRLKKQSAEETLQTYASDIESWQLTIAYKQKTIDCADLKSDVDGSVLYVKENLDSWTSDKDVNVFYVMDASVCAFVATDKNAASYITVGTPVVIELPDGAKYDADVSEVDEALSRIVFTLNEPDFSIAVGTKGTINLVLGESLQTLSVPKMCVFSTDEYDYVYVLSENGVRELNKVTIGVIGDDSVEILSGLKRGDSVILRRSN